MIFRAKIKTRCLPAQQFVSTCVTSLEVISLPIQFYFIFVQKVTIVFLSVLFCVIVVFFVNTFFSRWRDWTISLNCTFSFWSDLCLFLKLCSNMNYRFMRQNCKKKKRYTKCASNVRLRFASLQICKWRDFDLFSVNQHGLAKNLRWSFSYLFIHL